MESLDEDTVALLTRRAYDVAASTKGVKVYLNGKRVPIKNFNDYVGLYLKGLEDETGNPLKSISDQCGPRWEVAIAPSPDGFQQVILLESLFTFQLNDFFSPVVNLIFLLDVFRQLHCHHQGRSSH